MNEEFEFSTVLLPEWKEIAKTLNLGEALEYLNDSQDKIVFAILDINFFYYIIDKKKEAYQKWNEKLFENKQISWLPINNMKYCGQDIPFEILLNKISMNFFTSLHSFFDNYAHFLHLCLFPNEKIPERLNFYKMLNKISKNDKFAKIYNKMCLILEKEKYFKYIVDIDNINKHRSVVSPESTTWLNNGDIEIEMPGFTKKEAIYSKVRMVDALEDSLNLVNNFYKEITQEVFNYLEYIK